MNQSDNKGHNETLKEGGLPELTGYLDYLEEIGIESLHKTADRRAADMREEKQPSSSQAMKMKALLDRIDGCRLCKLHSTRTNIVPGEGCPSARLMFIGEGPGADEDKQGRPFIGRAGKLLTKIIEAMGIKREDVYIANIVKCRPVNNRNPQPDEISCCTNYLKEQIEIIAPEVICALGAVATHSLLGQATGISQLRGKFHEYGNGIKLMPTYHPAYLLRNPSAKKTVWEDVQKIMELLGLVNTA